MEAVWHQLILCNVMCGKTAHFGQHRTPATKAMVTAPKGRDSIAAGPYTAFRHPAYTMMHVVYHGAQCYPGYIVSYTIDAASTTCS